MRQRVQSSNCDGFYELPKDLNRIFNHADLVSIIKTFKMAGINLTI